MNIRILIVMSLLVSMGAVLHAVAPPILFGMRPDMLLAMMFLGIMIFPKAKYVVLLSIVTGIMSALTTTVPGGEISNLIDKPITAFVFFGLFLLVRNKINGHISAPVLTALGTIVSGSIFLSVALFIVGLMEGAFIPMFATVVLPAAVVNTIVMAVIYPVVQGILKRQPIPVS
ncbi:putative tryptophan transport protein [Lentibacillus sp. JNUCC-1]|uniref:tryptophan transporter n=1 Tax=Lentibacillus sp. JNUCC-1 TaxID=2654513 RepID=UPI0012E8258A|nr:tryptophan transporter [Lentibacillus sp. JNUCC-1]MUV36592.1 putative tryptophan transport protein [Lentibacillus sp. JNUCC-1]